MVWLPYAGFGVGVLAVIAAILQLNSMRKARIADVINHLGERWDSKEMAESRKLINDQTNLVNAVDTANNQNTEDLYKFMRVPNFFDALGVLVDSGCLPKKLVEKFMKEAATDYFDSFKPMLETKKYKGYFVYFRKLMKHFGES